MKLKTKKIVAWAILSVFYTGWYIVICWLFPLKITDYHFKNVFITHIGVLLIFLLISALWWSAKIIGTEYDKMRFTGEDQYFKKTATLTISKDIKSDGEWHAVARKDTKL